MQANSNSNKSVTEQRKIRFNTTFDKPINAKHQYISFDELNDYDFSKGFTEYLIKEPYVHLYFDFDEIKNINDLADVFDFLYSLEKVFSEFNYGGYTNDKTLSDDYGLRFIENDKHFVSMHVIFPHSCIASQELEEIMKYKDGQFIYNIHPLVDFNVYKLSSRQLFRHVLSDKIISLNSKENKQNHGFLVDAKPSDHIVQIKGDEPIITRDQWKSVFIKNEVHQPNINPIDQDLI